MTNLSYSQQREQLIQAAHFLFQANVMSHSGHGNMSTRLPGTEQILLASIGRMTHPVPEQIAIVTFDGEVTSFAKLQQRMQLEHPSDELRRKIPVWFYAFDLLNLNDRDIRELPLRERKKLLAAALDFKDPLRFTEDRETEGEAFFHEACRKGWEGIIAKNADSAYLSARSRDWLKFKCLNQQEFVIAGYTDPQGERVAFGALLVGYYEQRKLVYAGKVGTGYDTGTLRRLGSQLKKLEISHCPFDTDALPSRGIHWVKPKLVAQVAFGEWTSAGKLRQPRFLGLRSDKAPQEVVREGKHA